MFELKKIGIVKRASAWLLDVILLAVLSTGFMWILSLVCNFDAEQKLAAEYYNEYEAFRLEYMKEVAPFYGFTYEEEGNRYSLNGEPATVEDVLRKLVDSEGRDEPTREAYENYLLLPPADKVSFQYQYVYTMLFTMVSVGLASGYLVMEFILPILFKNGQTVGKKVFGICLVRPNCVRITNLALFARTVLGKFAIETMFPILLVFLFFFGGTGLLSIILLAAILLLNLVLFFATKNRTPIHDILAGTVAVDMKLQMIYRDEEELARSKAFAQRTTENTKDS